LCQESAADRFIKGLAEEVSSRLERAGVKGKTITLKVKVRKKGAPKETAKFLGIYTGPFVRHELIDIH